MPVVDFGASDNVEHQQCGYEVWPNGTALKLSTTSIYEKDSCSGDTTSSVSNNGKVAEQCQGLR